MVKFVAAVLLFVVGALSSDYVTVSTIFHFPFVGLAVNATYCGVFVCRGDWTGVATCLMYLVGSVFPELAGPLFGYTELSDKTTLQSMTSPILLWGGSVLVGSLFGFGARMIAKKSKSKADIESVGGPSH